MTNDDRELKGGSLSSAYQYLGWYGAPRYALADRRQLTPYNRKHTVRRIPKQRQERPAPLVHGPLFIFFLDSLADQGYSVLRSQSLTLRAGLLFANLQQRTISLSASGSR